MYGALEECLNILVPFFQFQQRLGQLENFNLRSSGVWKGSGGCLESTWELSRGCLDTSMVSGVCLGVLKGVLIRS